MQPVKLQLQQRWVTVAGKVRLWAPDRECRKLICALCRLSSSSCWNTGTSSPRPGQTRSQPHNNEHNFGAVMYPQPWFSAHLSVFLASLFTQLKPCKSICFFKLNTLDFTGDCRVEIPGLKEQNYAKYKHLSSPWWVPFYKNISKYLQILLLSGTEEVCLSSPLAKATFIGALEASCSSRAMNVSQQLPYADLVSPQRQSEQVGSGQNTGGTGDAVNLFCCQTGSH